MKVVVNRTGNDLAVDVLVRRVDGNNLIFHTLVDSEWADADVRNIVFDMDKVEYINSLGIAELISLHRYFIDLTNGKVKFTFSNLEDKIYSLLNLVEISKLARLLQKS